MVGKVTARSQGPLRKGRKQVTTTFKKGGTTINNFLSIKGNKGSYQKEFRAYDRENKSCKNNLCLIFIKLHLFFFAAIEQAVEVCILEYLTFIQNC